MNNPHYPFLESLLIPLALLTLFILIQAFYAYRDSKRIEKKYKYPRAYIHKEKSETDKEIDRLLELDEIEIKIS